MRRKALIISNPGEQNEENYCEGVLADIRNYRDFLTSSIGGLWLTSEIASKHRPSVDELKEEVAKLSAYDYSLVVFSGHGWYSNKLKSTVLVLRKGQEIDSVNLRLKSSRQSIILDCCRERYGALPTMIALAEKLARARPRINPQHCRRYYDKRLQECAEEIVVTYACATGEKAGDDSQRGGVYSHSLISGAQEWADGNHYDTTKNFNILSVVQAHQTAIPKVVQLRGNRQNPQIEKPRSGPYFPFCIVA